jgi:hypothetical protein
MPRDVTPSGSARRSASPASGAGRRRHLSRFTAACLCVVLLPALTRAAVIGDCDGNGAVTVDELVSGVNIALGLAPLSRCPAFDANGDGMVSIDELVRAVSVALAPPPTPTPLAQVFDFGVVGGQPCNTTQISFVIADGLDLTITALRIDFCVDASAFDVAHVTCFTPSIGAAIDSVRIQAACTLDSPVDPSGQVSVAAHGTGGDAGNAFEAFDEIDCTIPVFPDTAGGDYPVRYRVVSTTSLGPVVNVGQGAITVFGLDPTGRFQGECCTNDAQCGSGFCRNGDATQYKACCENDCAGGVCNASGFAGSCCVASDLPDTCTPP